MKRFAPTLALIPFLLAGCGDDSEPTARKCSPSTGTTLQGSGTDPVDVVYLVTATGDGTVSKVTYLDETGATQSESDPKLPWSHAFKAPPDAKLSISAEGEVTNGSIEVKYEASGGAPGSTFSTDGSDLCNQTSTSS